MPLSKVMVLKVCSERRLTARGRRWALADLAFPMQDAACEPAAMAFPAGLGHDSGEAEEVAP